MSSDVNRIAPSPLESGSPVTSQGASTSTDLTNTLMNDLNTFLGDLSPLAGEAIIGPGITALMEALDTAGSDLTKALGCFGTGLNILAPGMLRTAHSYRSLDTSLAGMFNELGNLLPEFEHYSTSVKLITPTAAQVSALNQYISLLKQGKMPQLQAVTATINVNVPEPDRGFWGNIGHWLSEHKWAAFGAAAVITIGGIALTVFTAGGSDVAAGAADTVILGGDAAAVAADGAAVTTAAATTDVAVDSSLLTYADFLAETGLSSAPAGSTAAIPGLSEADLAWLEEVSKGLETVPAGN